MSRKTILIVDDQEEARKVLAAGLGGRGYLVREADGGHAGLRAVHTASPDLVLLDASMPDMSGFEVVARLRADPATADLPVFILTASGRDPLLIERGLAAGADDYLVKPLRIDELVVRIESSLARRARMRARADALAAALEAACDHLAGLRLALDEVSTAGRLEREQRRAMTRAYAELHALERIAAGSHDARGVGASASGDAGVP